jgi:hypothetical protein
MNRFLKWLRTGRDAILHNALGGLIAAFFIAEAGVGLAYGNWFGREAVTVLSKPVPLVFLVVSLLAVGAMVTVLWISHKKHLEKVEQLESEIAKARKEKKPRPPPRRGGGESFVTRGFRNRW